MATIALSEGPQHVAITPDGRFAWVAHNVSGASSGTVNMSLIRTATGSVTALGTSDHGVHAVFDVGVRPMHVALTPDGTLAYVTNQVSRAVSVVRTSDYATVATIPVGTDPIFVAFAMVKSPQDEIAELQDAIFALEAAGRLNSGRARALRNHLANALRMLERGQVTPAVAQLQAFLPQVRQWVEDGVLTESEAVPLIEAAENALAGVTRG